MSIASRPFIPIIGGGGSSHIPQIYYPAAAHAQLLPEHSDGNIRVGADGWGSEVHAPASAQIADRRLGRNVQQFVVTTNVRMAGILIALIPLVIIYPYVQKYFVKGIMVGANKE